MSKNNILFLVFVLGSFCLFQISVSSEISQTQDISQIHENGAYSSFATFFNGETNVFICQGPGSRKYHYINKCRGLNFCSTNIYEVSLSEAKELKRTLCGWED